MRRTGSMLALTATLCLLVNCGGGSGENFNIDEQVKGCLADGTGFVFAITAAFGSLQNAIANDQDLGSGITITPHPTIDQAWNFHFPVDADQNGEADSAIDGTITFVGTDPTEGQVGDGDSADVTFQAAGVEGLSGSGSFTVRFSDLANVTIWGDAMMTLPDGCGVDVSISQLAPLVYGAFRDAVADVLGANVFGTVQVQASVRGHDIECTLTLYDDGNTIDATNVAIDGVEVGDFDFSIPLDRFSIGRLGYCVLSHAEGVFELADAAVRELLEEILDNQQDPNVTITPSGPTSFTFSIANLRGGTLSGSVSVTGIVQANSTVDATMSFEWRPAGSTSYVRTRNGAPMVLSAAIDETGQVSGGSVSGTFDCFFDEFFLVTVAQAGPAPTCQVSLTIPSQSPFVFEGDLQSLDASSGNGILVGSSEGNTLRVQLAGVEGSVGVVAGYLNGIPLPNFEEFLFGIN
jgi:hypothetical protein